MLQFAHELAGIRRIGKTENTTSALAPAPPTVPPWPLKAAATGTGGAGWPRTPAPLGRPTANDPRHGPGTAEHTAAEHTKTFKHRTFVVDHNGMKVVGSTQQPGDQPAEEEEINQW